MPDNPKARVFISCGQATDKEREIAVDIQEKIEQIGFEKPYVAIREQDLGGVKENILYDNLEKSEYFIFIDFIREECIPFKDDDEHYKRGSLFTNQELAIASYLKKPVCAFQEKGVKELDGLLSAIQANCIQFEDRASLSNLVFTTIQKKLIEGSWDTNWRNELTFEREMNEFDDNVLDKSNDKIARWYHIKIENRHWKEIARDCVAFLESIEFPDKTNKQLDLVEFKWKGVNQMRVSIPPKRYRFMDAFHVYTDSQNTIHLGINPILADFSGYIDDYTLTIPGVYKLNFIVFSSNFSTLKQTFYLKLGSTVNDVIFTSKEDDLNKPAPALPETQATVIEGTTIDADNQHTSTRGNDWTGQRVSK